MKILHIIDVANPKGNGVAKAVYEYTKYEKKYCDVAVYCLNKKIELDNVYNYEYENHKNIKSIIGGGWKPDLVVFNEVYKIKYLNLYKECNKLNIPYIIIPHGCLVDVAQKKRKIKKFLGNVILFNKFISKARAIQFLNEYEKKHTLFKYSNFIISGNGYDYFSKKLCKPTNKNLTYIGRYAIYHKGLDMLVDVCTRHKDWFLKNKITINLYGRPTGNDDQKLEWLINKNGISDILVLNGPIYNEDKIKLLSNTYAFIQTSRHEGEPLGVIEALCLGVPCIVTEGTSLMNFINNNKCGIGVKFDEEEVFNAIKTIVMSEEIRNQYAINALRKSKEKFEWDRIVKQLCKDYEETIEKVNIIT